MMSRQQESREHRECFGQMFPDSLHYAMDQVKPGKTFSFLVSSAGGMGVADRRASVNVAEWDECYRCPEFDSCYRLAMGKLALESALS